MLNLSCPAPVSALCDVQGGVMYDLSMVVALVKESWMEAPGNLIAHIRVSPFYHARKKVGHTLCLLIIT